MKNLTGHTGAVNCLKMITDDTLSSAGDDRQIKLWNVTSGNFIRNISWHSNAVYALETIKSNFCIEVFQDRTRQF